MIRDLIRKLSGFWLAAALMALALPVFAQEEENRSAARSLASQGAAAYAAGRYDEALDLFVRAETLVHAPPHLLYQARAAEKLGQLVRAHELFIRVQREPLEPNAPPAFQQAQAEAAKEGAALEPRLARVTIQVKAPPKVTYQVTMDGKEVPSALVGVSYPVDPGQHEVTVTAPGHNSQPLTVTLAEGESQALALELVALAPGPGEANPVAPPVRSPSPPPDAESDGSKGGWMRTAAYVGWGVGAAGLIGGTIFVLDSRSKRKDADKLAEECGTGCLRSDPRAEEIDSLDDKAGRSQTLAIVGFVVGGVGAIGGTTLYLLSGKSAGGTTPTSANQLVPLLGLGQLGVRGSF